MISVKVKVKSSQRAFLFDHKDKPHVCVFRFFHNAMPLKYLIYFVHVKAVYWSLHA